MMSGDVAVFWWKGLEPPSFPEGKMCGWNFLGPHNGQILIEIINISKISLTTCKFRCDGMAMNGQFFSVFATEPQGLYKLI